MKVSIKMLSGSETLRLSYGEVLKPDTINYKTYKPEEDGLFCEKIFGPVKDYECSCGKYQDRRYKGLICNSCHVEITNKLVRRERIGHIKLVVPVVHLWAYKIEPSKLSFLLNISPKDLEKLINYEEYIILNINKDNDEYEEFEDYNKYDLISENTYQSLLHSVTNNSLKANDPKRFIAKTGSSAIKYLLKHINIYQIYYALINNMYNNPDDKSNSKKLQYLRLFKKGYDNAVKPENLIITILPVIPPDLRPIVFLEAGKYATSDLNEFYRKIIIINNRLKDMILMKAPNIILKNEKKMLQDAVNNLFDNSKNISEKNRLKSLYDSLKGKKGRFRQNLLGKRVDYSARSVIVVGPNLRLNECGIPKNMAAELYKPFLMNHLIKRKIVKTYKEAKELIDNRDKRI